MKSIYLSIFALAVLSIAACSKKKGCTDEAAINYSSKAEKDCCCEYEGRVVMWYTKAKADSWASMGVTSLKFYLDGEHIHTKPVTDYWTGPPTCGESGSLTFSKRDSQPDISGTIEVLDQNGASISFNGYSFVGSSCVRIQL